MGSVVTHCCRREVPDANDLKNDRPVITGGLLSGAAPPALLLQTPLEVERCDEPRAVRPKTRTSFAAGRSVTEQLGFSLYEALPSETQWLNEAVDRLWEYIEQAIRKLLQEDITKKIREDSEQSLLKTFEFTSCNFGRARPKFGQMKVRSKGNLLEFFLELDWDAPESDIAVSLGSMKLGMQHLKLTGSLLLVFSPLLEKLPLVGGLSVTFPDIPEFSWTWTGSAGLGIRSIAATLDQVMALDINKKIVQAIFEQLVVPNQVYVDIAQLAQERQLPKEERIENYRSPDPIGVLYITIWEARDLPAADISLRGSSSDPYVVVKVGNNSWQTIKRTRTLRPVWGPAHSMDFLVFHMEQHVCVDVFDSDMLSFDDLLGYVCTTNTRRPRISDVIPEVGEEDTREWDLHNKHGKLGGKLKMTCRFRELRDISERAFVEPQWLTCNNCQDPLQESKSLRACSLCGSRPSSQFLRCGSCFSANDARFECAKDNFRCCSQCWQERRPAAAMLRVCLREGLVPADDVLDGAGVALGVKVEGTTQWSAPGVRPTYDNMAEKSEAQRWIRNLCESFDKASVAKCLEISAEQVQEAVNKAKDRDETRASDLIGHEAVIWDHALHFLVRDPHEELQATVIYQGKSRTADQVPLFPKKVRESLRVSRGDRGAARADRRGLPMSEEPLEVTWTINLDSARTASIFADVALHGLLPLGST